MHSKEISPPPFWPRLVLLTALGWPALASALEDNPAASQSMPVPAAVATDIKALDSVDVRDAATPKPIDIGYVARNDGVRDFFNALSVRLKKPVIVSNKAALKKVSGDFDLSKPNQTLEQLSTQLGLIWYHDGQSIYIYDASEAKNTVVSLKNTSIAKLRQFLQQAGLYDRRFPFRGADREKVFYLSAPPVYVDLVSSTASFLDASSNERALGNLKIGVVRLQNTFVVDRNYSLRGQSKTVPGIASIIEEMLENEKIGVEISTATSAKDAAGMSSTGPTPAPKSPLPPPLAGTTEHAAMALPAPSAGKKSLFPGMDDVGENKIRVLAYPDTNSLLIKGTTEQVAFIEDLIAKLDIAKRHVELSLWIIDLQAEQLDQLGVSWNGAAGNSKFAATINSGLPTSTLDGYNFIASVKALNSDDKAKIVSRPVVLTQENTPAFFDHNRSFYVKLEGERAVQLDTVTFGTLIKVLPRFAEDGEIEMTLEIEDGNEVASINNDGGSGAPLPKVARTNISTVARVPHGKSLLVGGYTRDEGSDRLEKIPLLGDLPWVGGLFRTNVKRANNLVRVFLIEPRYNETPRARDAGDLGDAVVGDLIERVEQRQPQQETVRDYLDRKNGN